MSDTPRFAMPLLDAAQAQKHVTVNEALSRADALAAGRVERRDLASPPASPEDGEVYIVAAGAAGDWAGRDGALALFLNGGWEFVDAWEGASFWVGAERLRLTRIGGAWIEGRAAGAAGGAMTLGRVIEAIAGASSWSLGVAGGEDRYGSGYGTGAGSYAHGVTGQPQAYYGDTALVLTAAGGSFASGAVRLAVHLLEIVPPGPV